MNRVGILRSWDYVVERLGVFGMEWRGGEKGRDRERGELCWNHC